MKTKRVGKGKQDMSGGYLSKTGFPIATGKVGGRTQTSSVHTTRKNGRTGTAGGRGQSESAARASSNPGRKKEHTKQVGNLGLNRA